MSGEQRRHVEICFDESDGGGSRTGDSVVGTTAMKGLMTSHKENGILPSRALAGVLHCPDNAALALHHIPKVCLCE